jgi:protein ImuB
MAQSLKSLAPSPREAPPSPRSAAAAESRLWLAVRLPGLALESVSERPGRGGAARAARAEQAARRPVVVVEPRRGRLFVAAVDAAASALGISPGLGLGAAYGFCGSLEVIERSLEAERSKLEALAAWCERLSPVVCIEPPDGLLLEVQGSLRLFGGLESIKAMIGREARERGFATELAAGPTPLGALWLVRGGRRDAFSPRKLQSLSNSLPLAVTQWPDAVQILLADMGVGTIGGCLRLPRDGFARRVGPRYLQDLDKALGRLPDPRGRFAAPQSLSFRIELSDQTTSLAVLDAVTERLSAMLSAELRARQAEVRNLRLVFDHHHRQPTIVPSELVGPSHDERRFADLLHDKLERMTLPVPTTAIALEAGPLQPIQAEKADLFEARRGRKRDGESPLRLVERLRGRLGPQAVYGLASPADHRPERAWTKVHEPSPKPQPPVTSSSHRADRRPLWLLPAPKKLGPARAAPRFNGPLRLVAGPERIESGWWDEQDVGKDYFTARNESGQRLWIYFDRRRGDWYLHGVFG